ncbi:MAG: ATP-binding protein [Chloroflexota bacterium]
MPSACGGRSRTWGPRSSWPGAEHRPGGTNWVGKSHLMNGLVIEALKRGYSGLYLAGRTGVLTDLQASRGMGRTAGAQLLQVDVLALDDVGLRPLDHAEMAEDL